MQYQQRVPIDSGNGLEPVSPLDARGDGTSSAGLPELPGLNMDEQCHEQRSPEPPSSTLGHCFP